MESCVAELRSKETTANKGKFAQFADSCKSKAEEDFQERGGDMEELGLIKEEAQRKSMMEASRACINEDTNVKGKTLSGAAKETAYAAAAKACAAKEEEAFIAAGGNVQDLKVERQKKKSSAVRSSMESCVKNHADILETCSRVPPVLSLCIKSPSAQCSFYNRRAVHSLHRLDD